MHKKNFETEAGKQSDSHPSTSPATQYKTVEREGASELNRNEAAAASGLRKPDRCPNEARPIRLRSKRATRGKVWADSGDRLPA